MGRLKKGDDLLGALQKQCEDFNVTAGEIRAIGAVSSARVGYYDQAHRKYEFHDLQKPMEILSLIGNISLKDGKPFVHAHITLADETGVAVGGHLAEGSNVFACEFVIHEFLSSGAFTREFDDQTGLFLWPGGKES